VLELASGPSAATRAAETASKTHMKGFLAIAAYGKLNAALYEVI
jgi:hypothetical protein